MDLQQKMIVDAIWRLSTIGAKYAIRHNGEFFTNATEDVIYAKEKPARKPRSPLAPKISHDYAVAACNAAKPGEVISIPVPPEVNVRLALAAIRSRMRMRFGTENIIASSDEAKRIVEVAIMEGASDAHPQE